MSASDPAAEPFLTLKFYKNGYMEWETKREVQPQSYIELKAFAGTCALILHQLMDWSSTQMRLLMMQRALEDQGDPLMRFLEQWEPDEKVS